MQPRRFWDGRYWQGNLNPIAINRPRPLSKVPGPKAGKYVVQGTKTQRCPVCAKSYVHLDKHRAKEGH